MNNDQQVEAAAKAIWAHVKIGTDPAWEDAEAGDGWEDDVAQVREMATAALAAAHPTITTPEELDALGTGAIVADFGPDDSELDAPVIACKTGRGDWAVMGGDPERRWRSSAMVDGANGVALTVLHWGNK